MTTVDRRVLDFLQPNRPATVVEFPQPKPKRKPPEVVPTTSEAFERAWSTYPDIGRRRSSRVVAWPQWRRVAAEIGEDRLEAAVRAYAADPVERKKEAGAPGFDRWLKWGRWEHWLDRTPPEAASAHLDRPRRFIGEAMRESFHARFHDERARDWFDRCYRSNGLREFVGAKEEPRPRQEWVDGPFRLWMRENGLSWFRWAS